jgi:UDP-N-acetylmuramoyl-tripeptide--D-alanyl-D-alanine ligase
MADRLFTIDELIKAVGGEIYQGPTFADREIYSVIIDSREASAGCLFVPLKGERTDGHLYIGEFFGKGGKVSLADRRFWVEQGEVLKAYAAKYHSAYVIVPSALSALQALAAYYLRGKKAFRIGVTGSNGKTTTKEIIGSVLSRSSSSFMNRGNLNSEIGLPLSAFEVKSEHRYAVFEMGMNREGEMDILTDIVRPQCALITNIGTAHIGNLGTKEKIAGEKKKILLSLEEGRKGYVYENDRYFDFLKKGVKAEIYPFGEKSTPGFEGLEDRGLDGYDIRWRGKVTRFPLSGIHNLQNVLGAVSLCEGLGVPEDAVRAGIESVKPLFGRGQILRGDVTVLQDCYNANPDSMSSVLDFLNSVSWKGRKIAVLASMKELGDISAEAHTRIGLQIAASGLAGVLLFGDEMEKAYKAVQGSSFKGLLRHFTEFESLKETLSAFLRKDDLVLVKGSRSMALERVTEIIRYVRV